MKGGRGRRRKQPMDDFKETSGYWKLKGEALDLPLSRTGFGRGCRPFLKLTMELMNITRLISCS